MSKENVFIFGASNAGINVYNMLKSLNNVIGFIDNDPKKIGTKINDITVYSIDILQKYDNDDIKVIIGSMYYDEIANQLERLNIKNYSAIPSIKLPEQEIKLVIWDLDDTFWKGTLSEGNIEIIDKNINIIKELTSRGIVNSIVSKNDFTSVKDFLTKLDLWQYFVFAKIEWSAKALMVNNIISEAKLRAENVLYIDDNYLNLAEVQDYNSKINTVSVGFIDQILKDKHFIGKEDYKHERLKQYKMLETIKSERKKYDSSIDFLIKSDIKIEFLDVNQENIDRVVELIQRTNQLNYTKKRINKKELMNVANNTQKYENRCISIKDRFGYYGIIGFYCLDKTNNLLEHFLFSCRTLNLGIEQYVYSKLNFPKIKSIGEVATKLNDFEKPFWIKENLFECQSSIIPNEKKLKLLIRGGCDISQMVHYLENDYEIDMEFNYVKNNIPIHRDHTIYLKDSLCLDKSLKLKLAEEIPFIDKEFYETNIFNCNYDILIISLLMDYTLEIYQSKNSNIRIGFGGYFNLIDMDENDYISRYYEQGMHELNIEFKRYFENNYKFMGKISPSEFIENLLFLIKHINRKPVIFINGAEVESVCEIERNALNRHREMNNILDEFVSGNENCYLLDMRNIIKCEEDIEDNIRHYKRQIYAKMSVELKKIIYHIKN